MKDLKQTIKRPYQFLTKEELKAKKEQSDRQAIRQALASINRKKNKHFTQNSIYSGGKEIIFDFDDWKPNKASDAELAKKLGNKAYILAKKLQSETFNVVLYGPPGVGKTSLAIAMARKIITDKPSKTYMFIATNALDGLMSEQYEYNDIKAKLKDTKRDMKTVDILILDDIGTEGVGKYVRRDLQKYLTEIADARINKVTLITTNNDSNELSFMYDEKLLDRLLTKDDNHILNFTGLQSIRHKNKT